MKQMFTQCDLLSKHIYLSIYLPLSNYLIIAIYLSIPQDSHSVKNPVSPANFLDHYNTRWVIGTVIDRVIYLFICLFVY